jgi:hypothetical protein
VEHDVSDNTFSYRWGIDILDRGFTAIPNLFLDHYAEAGVKRAEFLTIVHLARYQYERPDSECRPSVETVARQMGYTVRGLRKILARLEERGLLVRRYRPGKTTIYDFSGLSQALLGVADRKGEGPGDTPERRFRGTPEHQFRPPRNASSAEQQQKQEEDTNNTGAGVPLQKQEDSVALLTEFGITSSVARDLAQRCLPEHIRAWIRYAQNAQGVKNPQGLVVDALKAGSPPPAIPGASAAGAPGGVFV